MCSRTMGVTAQRGVTAEDLRKEVDRNLQY